MEMNLKEENYSQLVARYKELRKINREVQSYDLLKYISKKAIDVCGKKLGIMQNNTLVFDDMDQMDVVMDYCIYDYREEGLNAVDHYMDDFQLEPNSEKYAVLEAMSRSYYTLVQVEDVIANVGAIVNDVLGDSQFLLVDIGMGLTAQKGMMITARLLLFDDFVMTSGTALPVDRHMFKEIIADATEHYGSEDSEYFEVDIRQRSDFIAAIIRICLEARASEHIRYEDVENLTVTSPMHRKSRIGRNDPCPCGSGRKYKRCCGDK